VLVCPSRPVLGPVLLRVPPVRVSPCPVCPAGFGLPSLWKETALSFAMDSFLRAARERSADTRLEELLSPMATSVAPKRRWRIEWSEQYGRRLVANGSLPAAATVFIEDPLAVGYHGTLPGPCKGAKAVARELLRPEEATAVSAALQSNAMTHPSLREAVHQLTHALKAEGETEERVAWAVGVAANNVHAASDPPSRTVLGALSSIAEHSCAPNATIRVGAETEGSRLSLHTLTEVADGEPLSISYVARYSPTSERRRLLSAWHSFFCRCVRCECEPEWVRAFRCVQEGCEGAASPAHSGDDCRELVCDECGCVFELQAAAWEALLAAEACPEVCGKCLPVLHPYHHKMMSVYANNLEQVPAAARPELLCQFADAHARLDGDRHSELAAEELARAALACHAIGSEHEAAEKLAAAAEEYEGVFGASCEEASRCRRAQRALEEGMRPSPSDLVGMINPSWTRGRSAV